MQLKQLLYKDTALISKIVKLEFWDIFDDFGCLGVSLMRLYLSAMEYLQNFITLGPICWFEFYFLPFIFDDLCILFWWDFTILFFFCSFCIWKQNILNEEDAILCTSIRDGAKNSCLLLDNSFSINMLHSLK